MKVKLVLPALTEATSPWFRPIKYALFPPLGLATLAGHLGPDDEAVLEDEHVQPLNLDDSPDLVIIQVYITNARRAYQLADHYRARGAKVLLGGLHVTSLPDEAAPHADAIAIGPGDAVFPEMLRDLRAGRLKPRYVSGQTSIHGIPPVRRDLIERGRYLVPNSIVVTRGCPHHCDFCYKDAFFQGVPGFTTQRVDEALSEIERLPGKHLYFLDDHLLGAPRFARGLFDGMRGMGRLFQGASTVDALLRGDLAERAAEAGLRSVFVGFETLGKGALRDNGKSQNLGRSYEAAIARMRDLGVFVNGSFVFGLDGDDPDVFDRTVDWAVAQGLVTATFHIATPYPGTRLFARMEAEGRLLHRDWDRYDTRQVVFRPRGIAPDALEAGYWRAYERFYSWGNIGRAASVHPTAEARARHFAYSGGWKKLEPLWASVISLGRLGVMRPALEGVLGVLRGETAVPGRTPQTPHVGRARVIAPTAPDADLRSAG